LIIVIVSLLILIFTIKGLNNNLSVTTYKLKTSKLISSIRVAILTDLHSCFYGSNQECLINNIVVNNPDLVLFVGDIVDDKLPGDNAYITLKRVADKYPAYYVSGNHENYTGKIDTIKQVIREQAVHVLSGEQVKIKLKQNNILIKGLDDPEIGNVEYMRQVDALSNLSNNDYTILLAHRPERHDDYQQIPHDLVISGHAHGGQWRIPKLLPGLYAPHQGLFPKYTSGIYQLKNSKQLVSRGLSRENIKIPRFYNSPELIVLDLLPDA
jgi:predicted MPP superfamily phosphohydrolase